MTRSAQALSRPRRFASILGGRAPADAGDLAPDDGSDPRLSVDRRLYDEIGTFLFTHRLAPTPRHFELAHAYLTGVQNAATRAVADMVATTGTLDPARVAALATADAGAAALAGMADRLEEQLAACLSVTDRSQLTARDYGDAIDTAQARMSSDPAATLAHLAELTRDVVLTTRRVESELQQTRRVTDQLRGDLNEAREAAEHDHLTGLINRRGLERRIAALTASDLCPGSAVIALCDIDDFKAVNDLHGHPAGDRVLKFVADFLSTALGETACVARYGGEEFALLIGGTTPQDALDLLDAVRDRLAARALINQDNGVPIGRISFSAGVASLDADGSRAFALADAALYAAKRGGKNRVMLAGQG